MIKFDLDVFLRNCILLLTVIYFAQGSIYPTGSVISQLSLLAILSISFYYFFKTLLFKNKNGLFYLLWTILFLLNGLGFVFSSNYNELNSSLFKSIIVTLSSFYPFFYFSKKRIINANFFLYSLVILYPVALLQYFQTHVETLSVHDAQNVVNNAAYIFVFLIPFLFFIRNKVVALSLLGISLFFIIQGAKRGALLSGALAAIIYIYYLIKSIKHDKEKSQLLPYITVFLGLLFISIFFYHEFLSNEFLLKRLMDASEGNYSGRDEIYSSILNAWFSSDSYKNLIFGFGFAGSLNLTGHSFAHNDWLELLSNFGLLGVGIYLGLFIIVLKYIFNKESSIQKRLLLLAIAVIWLFMSFVSMWYTNINTITQAFLLGYIYGSHKDTTKVIK